MKQEHTMKKNPSRKSIPTIEQADYILGMESRLRSLASRVASVEADLWELQAKRTPKGRR